MVIGMVCVVAIAVVIMAFAPVAVSGFGITGHALWLACSVIALLVFFAGDEVVVRVSRERRAFMAAAPMRRRWKVELAGVVTWIPATVALVLVILGVLPEHEGALYFLAAVLFLLLAALLLLMTIFGVGSPRSVCRALGRGRG
jgi:hypothetical protein